MTALGLTFAPAALAQGEPTSPPRVIFDGDLGPDPCDFANLAMAHNLHDAGEIELLGFMSTLPEASNIAVLDIMNDRHGHDIPISMFKDPSDERYNRFVVPSSEFVHQLYPASRSIASRFSTHDTLTPAQTPSSTKLYRELLAAEPDNSVTIFTQGQLFNIKALLASGPDEISPLSGAQLLEAKTKKMVMMIGAFGEPISPADLDFYRTSYLNDPPNGYGITTAALHAVTSNGVGFEYNALGFYPGLTQDVFAQLDRLSVPKTILGNEQGWKVPTGDAYSALPADHPVRMAYAENNALSEIVHPGRAKNNPAYDELALYYLARGTGTQFAEVPGHATFGEFGTSTWTDDAGARDRKLVLTPGANDGDALSDEIERLVVGG